MKYRRLDANGDYTFGHGSQDYLEDSNQAVAQAIKTALALFQGEWFLDITAGIPWFTQVTGKYTQPIYDSIIQAAVLDIDGVVSIQNYVSSLDNPSRVLSVNLTVLTEFSTQPVVVATVVQTGYGTGGYGVGGFGE